jgi:hypothetical protein
LDHKQAETVFTAVLGVAGTWVSTILVFYFTKENFQAAQTAVNAAVGATVQAAQASSTGRTDSTLSAAMTPLEKLQKIELSGANAETSLPLGTLCKIVSSQDVRVPVLVDGVAKYIVHGASVFRFMADRALDKNPVVLDGSTANTTFKEMTDYKLKNGPNQGKTYGDVLSTFVLLPVTGVLSTAKSELMKTAGAQDVVVTQTGALGEKMLGMITSDDLAQISS